MAFKKYGFQLSPKLRRGLGNSYKKPSQYITYASFSFIAVSLILGIWTVSTIIKHSKDAPSIKPQILGVSDSIISNDEQKSPFTNYTVKKGDTIYNIAQNSNVSWSSLANINNLAPPFVLKIGQIIKIPK